MRLTKPISTRVDLIALWWICPCIGSELKNYFSNLVTPSGIIVSFDVSLISSTSFYKREPQTVLAARPCGDILANY